MSVIKAIFFDLDGTLLTSKKEISLKTRHTLEKCKSNNIKLFIATARPPLLDKQLPWGNIQDTLFDGGCFYNGGCIIIDGSKTYYPIAGDIVRKSVECVCQYDNINIALQLEGEKHAFRYPLDESDYNAWGVSAESALNLSQADGLSTVKIVVFPPDFLDIATPIDPKLAKALEELHRSAAQFYLTDKGTLIQIMAKHVNKASGIEKIRLQLGLKKNEIAVFGDDVNDMEMLAAYENSVAMGNAEEVVKQTAAHVTLDNDDDGVHYAIANILKIQM